MIYTIHHSITDGWSDPIIFNSLLQAYQGLDIPRSLPFKEHVAHLLNIDESQSAAYWSRKLESINHTPMPLIAPGSNNSTVKRSTITEFDIDHHQVDQFLREHQVTKSTLCRAAWALTLKYYCRSEEITFGTVTSGRESGLENIERYV